MFYLCCLFMSNFFSKKKYSWISNTNKTFCNWNYAKISVMSTNSCFDQDFISCMGETVMIVIYLQVGCRGITFWQECENESTKTWWQKKLLRLCLYWKLAKENNQTTYMHWIVVRSSLCSYCHSLTAVTNSTMDFGDDGTPPTGQFSNWRWQTWRDS